MAEATIQEKQNLAELNQTRSEENENESIQKPTSGKQVNIAEFLIILGIALIADFAEIPVIGWFVDGLALGILWLWRILKGQAGPKKDLTFQLILAFLAFFVEITPLGFIPTWTVFVLYIYFKDTKLGKETIGRAKKLSEAK